MSLRDRQCWNDAEVTKVSTHYQLKILELESRIQQLECEAMDAQDEYQDLEDEFNQLKRKHIVTSAALEDTVKSLLAIKLLTQRAIYDES